MSVKHLRRALGALGGFMLLGTAAFAGPAAAAAGQESLLANEEIASLSDQEFIDYAMDEGEYEVGEDGSITIYDTRPQHSGSKARTAVSPACIACAEGHWKIASTSGPTRTYSAWSTKASGWGPGTLSRDVTVTEANGYSGSLDVTKSALNASVGFDVSWSKSVTNTYTGELKNGKQGHLQVRHAYDRYSVKQEYVKLGKTTKTSWVYPKEYAFTDHRISY